MKKKFYTLLLLSVMMVVCGIQTVSAHDGCGFDQSTSMQSFLTKNNSNARIVPGGCEKPIDIIGTLPVVVHYIGVSPSDTIQFLQVQNTLDRLNNDFRNSAGYGPDIKIRFVLAQRDPNGNPTNGINFIDGSQIPSYVQYGITKTTGNGVTINQLSNNNWPTENYINIFVVNKFTTAINGTIGYFNLIIKSTQFSGSVSTCTHEMGHYFGLWHVFSETGTCSQNDDCTNQGDFICDTPPILSTDFGNSSSCISGDASNSTLNFMGYNGLRNRFTFDQKTRIRETLYDYLWSLVMSEAQIPTTVGNEVALDAIENDETETFCGNSFIPRVTLRNIGTSNLSSCKVQVYVDGVLKTTTPITAIGLLKGGNRVFDLNPTPITAGTHNIRCVLSEINGSASDYFVMNNSVCGDIIFQEKKYTFSITANDGGSVSGSSSGSYGCGVQINLNAIPGTNHHVFDNYMENGNILSTVTGWSFILETDRNITANFKLKSYTVNISSADATKGTITTTGSTVYGSAFSTKAQCKTGCKFDGWKNKNGITVSTDSILNFTVKNDTMLVAQFSPNITTGINQQNLEKLTIYPNPATDWVILKGFQNKILTIYDISGTEVSVQDIINEQIDISGLPTGMYMLCLEDQEKIYTGKLIKQ